MRMIGIMKDRSIRTGKLLLDGAVRIVTVPHMDNTRRAIEAGSLACDWRALGADWRRSIEAKQGQLVG